jgi:hypothetical protein
MLFEFNEFKGDTPETTEGIGENPRIQVPETPSENEEVPQITEPELEIPTETETSIKTFLIIFLNLCFRS